MKRFGNRGTYLQVIQSLQYVCATVTHTVADSNITSDHMATIGLSQFPQVS